MNSQGGYGSSFMFESINNELNASLATADELSREFSSLLSEAAPVIQAAGPQSSTPQININSNYSVYNPNRNGGEADQRSSTRIPSSDSPTPRRESNLDTPPALTPPSLAPPPALPLPGLDALSSAKYRPSSPSPLSQQHSPFMPRKDLSEPRYFFEQRTPPNSSPNLAKKAPPTRPRLAYGEQSPSSSPTSRGYTTLHEPPGPRLDRAPSPFASLPRTFQPFRPAEEAGPRQKSPSKWNESDLDAAYERKPHQTYDKSEWIRFPGPNSNWKESNLDAPPAVKDAPPRQLAPAHSSLPRNTRISIPPDLPPSAQPIISRISMPPSNPAARQHRPIPLSVIMRLQNPHYSLKVKGPQPGVYQQAVPLPREYFRQVQTPQQLQKQPAYYKEEPVRHPPDVDAEPERQSPSKAEALQLTDLGVKPPEEPEMPPRPLSPTRLQPVVAPQAELVGDLDELMRIRAEFPRALKKRGSAEVSLTLQDTPFAQPNPYKQMMNKLFRRKTIRVKEEPAAESGSSSDGEEGSKYTPSTHPIPITVSSEQKGIHSILRKSSKTKKSSNRRAHLSPLVLMLDGALVGELDTVQRAAQEMSDPSQANDEGITALHNAICGGHFPVVEFLVRVGANVSAPDSHGWTPLHCAASCNDSQICEFLVRSGAAVMAVTDSDGATAAQKCDPFAPGFQECESFLRGVEEAMGVQNSGVVYALWAYPAQAPDELSFKEGDMVTILQKPEAIDWWWASLCGREGLVPNNYFGLFPKIRSKSLC